MRCIHSPLLRRTHPSFMCRACSCVASIYRPCVTLISHSCVALILQSCVALILRSCVALMPCSCFSHAAWSPLDLLFSLTCIKSQTSQPEYSATVRTSMRADVHIAHCRPTQLLFSLVHSLNTHLHQSIFLTNLSCNPYKPCLPRFSNVTISIISPNNWVLGFKDLFHT